MLEGGQAGGRVFLVDFGGVQAAAASEALGMASTVIGTYGHMAPEQFRGAAQPASDLYGLGGTLLYLLSGRGPRLLTFSLSGKHDDCLEAASRPHGSCLRYMHTLSEAFHKQSCS